MSRKNLLGDTDHTDGRDNRFASAVMIGKVSKIECSEKGANVRAIMPDRTDHAGQPLITKPIPVLQISAGGKKSFAMPRVNQNVLLVKLPNSTSTYAAIGFFYTTKEPPPKTDPRVDYVEWEGGHSELRDSNDDADVFLTQDFKGGWKATVKKDINIKTTDGAKTTIESDGDVLIKSATGNINVESPTGIVTIKQQTIELQAAEIKLTGLVTVNGNMNQTGTHRDSIGLHTGAARLEERVKALEAFAQAAITRIEALEAKLAVLNSG